MAWFGLPAEFSEAAAGADRRGAARRQLVFASQIASGAKAMVLDLSEAGLMLHAQDRLTVGEVFEIALVDREPIAARVVWKRTTLYGCKFLSPVSRGTISAIVLKARPGASIATEC